MKNWAFPLAALILIIVLGFVIFAAGQGPQTTTQSVQSTPKLPYKSYGNGVYYFYHNDSGDPAQNISNFIGVHKGVRIISVSPCAIYDGSTNGYMVVTDEGLILTGTK